MSVLILCAVLMVGALVVRVLQCMTRIELSIERLNYTSNFRHNELLGMVHKEEIKPKPVRIVPRYPVDYESSQLRVLDEFKETK